MTDWLRRIGRVEPPKSRVLLMLALLKTRDPAEIRAMFNE